MTDIGAPGGPQATATAINSNGQIVGLAQTSTDADHGFLHTGGKMTDLGLNIFPYAINGLGGIIGQEPGDAMSSLAGISRASTAWSRPDRASRSRAPSVSTTTDRLSPQDSNNTTGQSHAFLLTSIYRAARRQQSQPGGCNGPVVGRDCGRRSFRCSQSAGAGAGR
jgi:probable HAF family extracellular repeat protein